MHIPPRYQAFVDSDQEPMERLRKGRGRLAAYRSSNPEVRKSVRLTTRSELNKVRRAARSLKITMFCDETLDDLRVLAYNTYAELAWNNGGRRVPDFAMMRPENLDRVTVNYIRHNRTKYEHTLIVNGLNTNDLRRSYNIELKIKCLAEIARVFPELAAECERQRLAVSRSLQEAVDRIAANEEAGLGLPKAA
ncbi:hypothetical protein [Arthrobacter caoxuetaonis]|uniref:Uncharacterized protein n=1 Tax=Arthrobacter caoxuetaonis TaxID=2886935 RepID=A0A9X1SGU4_9MICC|nr:hypothetical protein [Arthrobacter caoxuetaonis]MCC3299729.1 hypothetical protein [Arthrobacter caoxuetaonis]USQ59369.1 hypothetical protein NF551_17630 [Arthrobacter caoxuetaonis]